MLSLSLSLPGNASYGPGAGSPALTDFSALPALPVARRSAVETAAASAATTLGVTTQSVIDTLSFGRGFASFLPNDGCLLVAPGGATTVQGDPVGAIRTWSGNEIGVQANASLKPVSAAPGMYGNGAKSMGLTGITGWTAAEAITVFTPDWVDTNSLSVMLAGYWKVGNGIGGHIPYSPDNIIYDSFFLTSRVAYTGIPVTVGPVIYTARHTGTNYFIKYNATQIASNIAAGFSLPTAPEILRSADTSYTGWARGLALNPTLFSTAQRAAIEQFCKNYYGVSF